MADKTVTYKNKIISASVIDDFYARLNHLRTQGGVATLTIPTTKNKKTLVSQMTSLYSAVLSTKNAVSFLKNVELTHTFAGISAGNIMVGPNSVSIIEHNIGQLENACKAYFSTNKSGYRGSSNFSVNHATNCGTNQNASTHSAFNAPFCSTRNAPFRTFGNSAHCVGFNSGRAYSGFQPHHGTGQRCTRGPCGKFSFFAVRDNGYGFCPNGFTGCNFVRHCGNYSGFFSTNFSGFNAAFFTGFNTSHFTSNNRPVCTAVHSSNFSTVYNTNNAANFSGVNTTCTVVWGAYSVEGIADA